MIAARVREWGAPPRLEEVPDPVAGPGETLVRVSGAALGHIDLTVAGGEFPHRPVLPYTPGTDGAGIAVVSGAPVRIRGGGVGLARDGTWAELVAVPDDAVWPLRPEVGLALAACFFSPATTAWTAVHEVGALRPGERVAVTGAAGAVGSLAVQLAMEHGAAKVFGIVGRPAKGAAVPRGAEVVVGALAAEHGAVDLLIDTVGGAGLAGLLGAVTPGGRAALVGYTAGTSVTLALPALLAADVRLLPVNMLRRAAAARPLADVLLPRLLAGELTLAIERHPLADLSAAIERVRTGAAGGRVVLVP